MKKIILFFLLTATGLLANAQFKKIAEGPEFDEPRNGYTRIIQMKNGGTLFLYIILKGGIDIRIYDANHKEKVNTSIEPGYGKLSIGTKIIGSFEINNDAVLLISTVEDKVPLLYRLIIDGKTGRIKKEDKIGELMKINIGQNYATLFGKNTKRADFYASCNLPGSSYAVAAFNSFESDRNKRIEIIVFGTTSTWRSLASRRCPTRPS
jgi:hypothetical protein